MLVTPLQTGKMRHHGVARAISAKLSHCTSLALVYPMENEMSLIHHVVEW